VNGQPLLRASEVAELLSVDKRTAYRWAWEGRIPSVRLSDKVLRFDREAVEAWITERSQEAIR
jgi:excisionase family DNA binding protein